ncbi:MAG: hypothetical protein H6632_17140 [Anaerolineales bacterium]|nr:hypothetical protein [Anaerolineales bacterium]
MPSTYGERQAENFLKSHGLTVTKIPESSVQDEKTPDFLVEDGNSGYIVEVKDREDQKFMALFESHIPGEKTVGLEYDNRISAIIKQAVNQLNTFDETNRRFKILWFYIDSPLFSDLLSRKIGFTLYGLQEVEGFYRNGTRFQTGCFYFTDSEFFRCKELDAVVVQGANETELCINDFSVRSQDLRQSKIYQLFIEEGLHLIEPSKIEAERRCFIADCSINRRNSEAVLDYIKNKYNLRHVTPYNYTLFNLPL